MPHLSGARPCPTATSGDSSRVARALIRTRTRTQTPTWALAWAWRTGCVGLGPLEADSGRRWVSGAKGMRTMSADGMGRAGRKLGQEAGALRVQSCCPSSTWTLVGSTWARWMTLFVQDFYESIPVDTL